MDNNLVAFISRLFPVARVQPNFDKLVFDNSLDDYLIGAVVIPGPAFMWFLFNMLYKYDLTRSWSSAHYKLQRMPEMSW